MFFLKKVISYFLLPFPFVLILLAAGIILLWFTARQRTGKVLITVAMGVTLFFSSPFTSDWICTPLESWKPLADPATQAAGARFIVVLGSGFAINPAIPANSRLTEATLVRLIEAIRIYRALPGAKLIMSGGKEYGNVPQSQVMADVATMLGVPRDDLILESQSDDTQDEAALIRDVVGKDRVVLVTSTTHMRRSLRLFEKQGMTPIAAPAGFWSDREGYWPSTGQLGKVAAAEHEYLGMVWSRLRGTM